MEHPPVTAGPVLLPEGNSGSSGPSWWRHWDLWLCLTVAVLAAFLLPLDDADLPMHLRTGAWILEHGHVPLVEPFAWTRAGAPFYAYSWLPEVLYALAWQWGGAAGLSALHALLLGGVVLALWDLSRAAQWSVWATRLILSVHLVLWLMVQPATRPQLFMAIAFPIAWAGAFHMSRAARAFSLAAVSRVLVAAAMAVNAHLFFFLLLAPVVVLLTEPELRWRRVLGYVSACTLGWLLSPYAAHLVGILRLNLGANALQGAASPIMEMEGGFAILLHAALGTRILVGLLLLLPFFPYFAGRTGRERWWFAMVWLCGLGLFGIAWRGLLMWWLLTLPLIAWALASIPLPQLLTTRRAVVVAWCASIVGLLGQATKARAAARTSLSLPHPSASVLEPAARWLACAVPPAPVPARGATAFDYGSYLTWRVPQVSWSIDGRVIFPDSVARADARQELRFGRPTVPPWHSAAVVLLPATHAVLGDIAADSAWQRVALAGVADADSVALFARREIAVTAGRCPLR